MQTRLTVNHRIAVNPSVCLRIAAVLVAAQAWATLAHAQTNVTLNGSSGTNSNSTAYSTVGGLNLSLGFFADYLVVGGGGGGGSFTAGAGGGGGGGQIRSSTSSLLLNTTTTYNVFIGAGGSAGTTSSGVGGTGQASNLVGFLSGSNMTIQSTGGGGGGGYTLSLVAPTTGASGGGGGAQIPDRTSPGANGTTGQGNKGGNGLANADFGSQQSGGGGGGAGGAGGNGTTSAGGAGGIGLTTTITGGTVGYGGGGGGGKRSTGSGGTTSAGGGAGGLTTSGSNGLANSGGGGGGGGGADGGGGGAGVVIVRYSGTQAGTGGTVTSGTGSAAGFTLHTFTTTGSSTLSFAGLNLDQRLGATLNGTLSGNGQLTFSGPGTLTLAGDGSNFTGTTRITAGNMNVTNRYALRESVVELQNAGSVLTFASGSSTYNVKGIDGSAGTVSLGGTVMVGPQDFSMRTGTIASTITGSGRLWVTRTALTLSGSNSYSGGTTFDSIVTANNNSAFGTGPITLSNQMETETVITLANDITIDARGVSFVTGYTGTTSMTLSGVISGPGGLAKAGAGPVILTGKNTYEGGTVVAEGRLRGNNASIVGNIQNNGELEFKQDVNGSFFARIQGTGQLIKTGSGTLSLTGFNTNSYTGGTVVEQGQLVVNVGTMPGNATVASGAVLAMNQSQSSGVYAGVISGSGQVQKSGPNVLVLTGSQAYTGLTTVQAGTLITGGVDLLPTTGTVEVQAAGTLRLAFDQTLSSVRGSGALRLDGLLTTGNGSSEFSGTISGAGGLTKTGTGVLTLSGNNTFLGDTVLNGGTLVLAAANSLPSDAVVTMSAGTLTVNQRTLIGLLEQQGGTVNGPGSLVPTLTLTESGSLAAVIADGADFAAGILKRTAGTTTIGAANTFTGSVKVQGGTVLLGSGGSFAAGSRLVMSSGATMDLGSKAQTFSGIEGAGGTVAMGSGSLMVNNATDNEFGGVITGAGGLVKQSVGNLVLTGTSTYTGPTTVSAGRLSVNGTLGNTAVAVESGAELGGSGVIGGAMSILTGGTLSPGNSIQSLAAGATTFAAGSTFEYEVDSTDPLSLAAAADLLVVNGNLTIQSGALLSFLDLATTPQPFVDNTTIFALINYSGSWNGGLFTYGGNSLTDGSQFTVGSQLWEIDYNRGSAAGLDNFTDDYLPASSFVSITAVTAVPEPATWALGIAGIAAALVIRRRK